MKIPPKQNWVRYGFCDEQKAKRKKNAENVDRTRDLQIFDPTLSQLSYFGFFDSFRHSVTTARQNTLLQRDPTKKGGG
jgi:hypothetical protein